MSYKSILVHVDDRKRSGTRVDMALKLATQFEAHLTALAMVQPVHIAQSVREVVGPEVEGRQMEIARGRAISALDDFEQRARSVGWPSIERAESLADPLSATTLRARYNDLVVVGQHDPDDDYWEWPDAGAYPELVALECGRPVLVVPYAGRFERIAENVLIAWDASREATRAVSDALPLLRRARKVTVMAVNPEKVRRHGAEPGADIAGFLARHGVRVEATSQSAGSVDVGNFLLSRISDMDIDLLVMGAYGHARVRELILGGVTQTILSSMTVPVLLSH